MFIPRTISHQNVGLAPDEPLNAPSLFDMRSSGLRFFLLHPPMADRNRFGVARARGGAVTKGTRQSGPHWRRVMAALANEDARHAYAQIVLGTELAHVAADLGARRRDRAIAVLLESGLVQPTADDELEASETIFRDLLTQQPKRSTQTGVARFMRLGRIERYPANLAQRRELLAWIASDAIRPGEDLTERQVNERLLSYTDDVVLLRRYLIDFGVLERTPSGSSYSRPAKG